MKKEIVIGSLGCFAVVALQLPALSDEVWFTKYASGPSGWTESGFVRAERAYEISHPTVTKMTETQIKEKFTTLDTDRDGSLTIDQVRTIHPWP